ncbi:hypothetical protein [Clostridium saccharoperbutylacetonicum]|uniref:hypothetical protein n=1 Tax=Clostridium saccharoperbutylacetonicum TaxID=36745 RepID=UPI0039EC30CB
MRGEKVKVYKSGDQINLRLSKSRVSSDVIIAINKANKEGKLNEYVINCMNFFEMYKYNKCIIIPEESTVESKLETRNIVKKPKEEQKINEIKKINENRGSSTLEDELFDTDGNNSNGLNGALSLFRR